MSLSLGVSTSSCPELRACELAEAILASGGDSVELRIGRGHGWESDGVLALATAGVTVTTIASSRSFGSDVLPDSEEDINHAKSIGARLRCFLDAGYEGDQDTIRRAHLQVVAVQRSLGYNGSVVIEPHPGRASALGVSAFCAHTGASAVLDTFALQRLGIAMPQAFSTLGGATQVLHVKGFVQDEDRRWSHRALAPSDLPDLTALGHAPELAAVVVETKAGSHWRDLRLLRAWANTVPTPAAEQRWGEPMTQDEKPRLW